METQLLCTFTEKDSVDETLEKIEEAYEIAFDKIFVLQNEEKEDKLFCTYNIDTSVNNSVLPKTISIHRKKKTNTLYTINALNELIKNLNDGVLDKTYQIPWEDYQNSLLVTHNGDYKRIDTQLFDIVEV